MIELSDISKCYGEAAALNRLDLTLASRQTHVLIGPSGSGKSTLLRIIIGLITPDTGTVRIAGETLAGASLLRLRQRIGYVIQDGGLFPHLTVRENVAIVAKHLRWPRDRIDRRLAELTELTQLPPSTLPRYPTQLSGGQQQRVSLIRALMLDPEVLLLDEPLGALDPMIRSDLQQDLRGILRDLGKTTVLVTHDLREAVFFADQLILLRSGRVAFRGAAAELFAAPPGSFAARFIRAQHAGRSDSALGSSALGGSALGGSAG